MVFACLALSVFSTIDQYQEVAEEALIYMEGLVVLWFTVEFFFRYILKPAIAPYFSIQIRLNLWFFQAVVFGVSFKVSGCCGPLKILTAALLRDW
jgi:hypothetical protein